MPCSHCPNKVFSDRLNWPYDSPGCLRSGGKLFHTLVPAAAKVLSPKLLDVRLTASVRVSAERSGLRSKVVDPQKTAPPLNVLSYKMWSLEIEKHKRMWGSRSCLSIRWGHIPRNVVITTIRLLFDGRSTAYQRSLRSQ